MIAVGIDPGKSSGAIAVINCSGAPRVEYFRLEKSSDEEVHMFLWELRSRAGRHGQEVAVALEKLSNMGPPMDGRPGRGSKANWSLSGSYHGLRMALICCHFQFEAVTASKWQGYLNCRTKGNKAVSQARAKELFPDEKDIFQWQADALLLAHYAEQYIEPTEY